MSPEGELFLGTDIPVRRGEEGWAWLVVHVLAEPVPVGAEVELRVDAGKRGALSAAHTGCHLLALALNEALAPAGARTRAAWTPSGTRTSTPWPWTRPGWTNRPAMTSTGSASR
ncbi:hypothetical protein ACFQZC_18790 [Streptacidiphilus monticola]